MSRYNDTTTASANFQVAVNGVHPTPLGLARVARTAVLGGAKPGPFTPLYLRRPDAEVPGARKRVTAP